MVSDARQCAPHSFRLHYEPLSQGGLEAFHRLVVDAHIREYMMDGLIMEWSWSEQEVQRSARLFASHGVGLWLCSLSAERPPIGFCGYRIFEDIDPAPQLIYALTEDCTGQGLATESARACVAYAREQGMTSIVAAVDAPNLASHRVLQKLGFREQRRTPGQFGDTVVYRLD